MWWATLDYINQFVCTHTRKSVWVCVCAKVVLQPVILEKALTFAQLLLGWICCIVILQMCLVIITEFCFSCVVLLFCSYCLLLYCLIHLYLWIKIRHQLSDVGRCLCFITEGYKADRSYSSLFQNTVSRTRFPRIPADVIWLSHLSWPLSHWQCLLHTTRCHGVINKSQILCCSHPEAHTKTQSVHVTNVSVSQTEWGVLALNCLLIQAELWRDICGWAVFTYCVFSLYISLFLKSFRFRV